MNNTSIQMKNKKYNRILFIIFVIIIAILLAYTFVTRKQMDRFMQESVQENIRQLSDEMDYNIAACLSSIQINANMVSRSLTKDTLDNPKELIQKIQATTSFMTVEYIDKNGQNINQMGEVFDASNREYFKKGIQGQTGIWVNFKPRYSQEALINFYSPIYYEGEVVGVLTGVLGADTDIVPILQNHFLSREMIGIVCDRKGQIVASTLELPQEYYWKNLLDDYQVSEEDRAIFSEHAAMKNSEVFAFQSKNGKAMASISVNEETGWRFIQIVPPAYFSRVILNSVVIAYVTAAIISIMLIGCLIYIKGDTVKLYKKVLEEKDMEVQDYANIFSATVADVSKGIRKVDMESGMAEYIYFEDQCLKKKDLGDFEAWVDGQEKNVHPADFIKLKETLSMENLNTIKEGQPIQVNYRSAKQRENGYYGYFYSVVAPFMVENKKTIVITSIDNTDSVVAAIEQKQILASAASIYISMHILDIKNDTVEILSCADHIREISQERSDHMKENLRKTMYALTDDQHKEIMMDFINLDTLDERMQGNNTITLEFLGKVSGWCRARFIAVDYDKEGKLSRVIWAVENIDVEKKKENLLIYLSETDLMTGLLNRGSGEKRIKELLEQEREGIFFLLDVDKFKSINDGFGHNVGDKVLIEVAEGLKKVFSHSDVVMRLGGDEFAVYACDVPDKQTAIEKIRTFFENIESIVIPELKNHKIYISLGAAFKRKNDGEDFDSLYRNADTCTYVSKRVQGNAYTFHE